MIFLKPEAGLCNRLRAIASAIAIAKKTHQKLVVFWQTDYAMNTLFSDIFEKPSDFNLIEMRVPRNRLMLGLFKHLNAFVFRTMPPYLYSYRSESEFVENCLRNNGQRLFVLSSFMPFDDDREYGWLHPRKDLADQIKQESMLCKGRIGIHIRRTDHNVAIAASPLSAFYKQMDMVIELCPQQEFFVASDDATVKQQLEERYPGRIHTRSKVSARNDVNGVKDAVVDLWLLSMSTELYGSMTSSFSEEAARIGKIPLTWIGDK